MKNTFISKLDMAQAYFPYINPRCARQKLMDLINDSPVLIQSLRDVGYTPLSHSITPRQVAIITDYFGNPWK